MAHDPQGRLLIEQDSGVVHVTIHHPPVNALDIELIREVQRFVARTKDDAEARVIVFQSADPDFFIAHVDMTLVDLPPERVMAFAAEAPPGLNVFQALNESLRKLPQLTIAKLSGLARGGGAEFVMALDMRFAAIGRAGLAQCEAMMGIVPGGGGTQYLTSLVGRARALEIILGADLVDAVTAERYGWVNRALPEGELDTFVDSLARRIASLPPGVIANAKKAVDVFARDLDPGLQTENALWAELFAKPVAASRMRALLAAGAQTREGERHFERLLAQVAEHVVPPSS